MVSNDVNLSGGGLAPGKGRSFALTLAVAGVWLSLVVGAMVLIGKHTDTPGQTGEVPSHWPTASTIPLDAHQPTLVMFIHPHCPCTRASLGELERLMADCRGQGNVRLLFVRPPGTTEEWTKADLWHKASAISGVTVQIDNDGVEARRFQAETSGQTVLYGPDGHLLFQGGITLSRGHEGDNPGRSSLETLLRHEASSAQTKTPVFGCSLFDDQCTEGATTCKR